MHARFTRAAAAGPCQIDMTLDRDRQERRDRFGGADGRGVGTVPRGELQFVRPGSSSSDSGPVMLIPSGPSSLHAWMPSTTPGETDMPSGSVTTVLRSSGVVFVAGDSFSGTFKPTSKPTGWSGADVSGCTVDAGAGVELQQVTARHTWKRRRAFRELRTIHQPTGSCHESARNAKVSGPAVQFVGIERNGTSG